MSDSNKSVSKQGNQRGSNIIIPCASIFCTGMSKSMSTHSSISYDPTGMPGAGCRVPGGPVKEQVLNGQWTLVTQYTINVACDPMDFLFQFNSLRCFH